jgi:hypothetical protein
MWEQLHDAALTVVSHIRLRETAELRSWNIDWKLRADHLEDMVALIPSERLSDQQWVYMERELSAALAVVPAALRVADDPTSASTSPDLVLFESRLKDLCTTADRGFGPL